MADRQSFSLKQHPSSSLWSVLLLVQAKCTGQFIDQNAALNFLITCQLRHV